MLVYLSDIVEKYPNMTQEFERVFNETFHLLTDSNLGTLGMIKNADEKYDLILTNPPYITNGVTSLKKELTDKKLDKYYKKGKGVEALALQWIMNNLRENGRAFVVIPDSILIVDANIEIKKQILHQFNILCIISLPVKAFFNTPKKTYILGLEKRSSLISTQTDPVFTYIVSNVGETLDINRFEIEGKSDLESAKDLFNMFKGSPATFAANEIGDPRCKVQPIDRFDPKTSWDIEMWWPKKEKIDLGIEKKVSAVSVKEFVKEINNLSQKLKEYANELESLYD
jgi:type I restriction-modification system DNA methylase subunit